MKEQPYTAQGILLRLRRVIREALGDILSDVRSFPRHIHYGDEDSVVEDHVTELGASPEENMKRVATWIRDELLPTCGGR